MSEPASATPLILFRTLRNTELGASGITVEQDGSVVLHDVLKQVTEGMLTSYPRTQLGHWLPNRLRVRYSADQIAKRRVRKFAGGEELDLAGMKRLAD